MELIQNEWGQCDIINKIKIWTKRGTDTIHAVLPKKYQKYPSTTILCSGPCFGPALLKAWETFWRGKLRVRLTRDSPSRYRVMVNSPGVLSRQNASLVSQARRVIPNTAVLVYCLYVLCLCPYFVLVLFIVHDLLISYLVIVICTLLLGLNHECGHLESRARLTTFWGWNLSCKNLTSS